MLFATSIVLSGCSGGANGNGNPEKPSPSNPPDPNLPADLTIIGTGNVPDGDALQDGTTYNLSIRVRNNGPGTALAGSLCELSITPGPMVTTLLASNLGPGESADIFTLYNIHVTPSQIPSLTIQATVDTNNIITETDETNNSTSRTYFLPQSTPQ